MPQTDAEIIEAARLKDDYCIRCGGAIRYDQSRSKAAPAVDNLIGPLMGIAGAVSHRGCNVTHGVVLEPRQDARQETASMAAAWVKGPTVRRGSTVTECPACGRAASRRGRPTDPTSSRQWRCRAAACGADGTWRLTSDGEIVARVRVARV